MPVFPKVTVTQSSHSSRRRAPVKIGARVSAGIKQEVAAAYEAGSSARAVARKYDLTKNTVIEALRELGIPLRPAGLGGAQVEEAIKLYEAGKSCAQVAAILGEYPSTVNETLKRHGVQMRGRRGGRQATREK
ncbi:COG3415 family protein [Nakamurella multipartita]|uniref:Uncharacterized protein n=1 Tax=Nakamurella multipartita (strain ATCC 700099 / DSM 44233 / CIP 104796 / JCM 9543 / NBRC 105858 / Y-104) TaxID=479431 RepID=C8XI93_NAKMY|nr:hypothetical protein [Nakamurella multipartita]ACV78462.1 hypothetical protein Namu_2084 [Nakamurella multipartita DSM 44233]